jgi:RNA polymerase sigma-70 factor (ECF subfamily)
MDEQRTQPDQRRTAEFIELYSACQHSLYVYIVTLIGNPVDAHDVLQDVNLVLWEKFEQFRPGSNFRAWAREIARYRVLRYRQMRANDAPMLDPRVLETLAARLDDAGQPHDELYADKLLDCISQLSDADRQLIELRYRRKVQVKDLSRQLSRSENAVSQSLGRIRRLLRKCVEDAVANTDNAESNR